MTFFYLVLLLNTLAALSAAQEDPVEYGVDVSFPIHHETISTNYPWLPHNIDDAVEVPDAFRNMPLQVLGDRKSFYRDYMMGCIEHVDKDTCMESEQTRIHMAQNQPSAVVNYTETGFAKIHAPERLFHILREFWDRNRQYPKTEEWDGSISNTNNWKVPSDVVSVEDPKLRGGGKTFCLKVWDEVKAIISQWTGQELAYSGIYGIRVYKEGSILAPHVDRLPLVSSAIINVDQDVDEPWPLEVYGRDGKAVNITLEPGEMILYESHSTIHGRPFPLKGRYMANLFVHFEVVVPLNDNDKENSVGLPPYIISRSDLAKNWFKDNPGGRRPPVTSFIEGSTYAHFAAREGEIDQLVLEIQKQSSIVNDFDKDGYTPLHLAVKRGHIEIVKLLIGNGADKDMKSDDEYQATPLWWANTLHEEVHPVVKYLEAIGAAEVGVDL